MVRFGKFRFGTVLMLLATLILQVSLTAAAPAQPEQTCAGYLLHPSVF